MIWPLWPLMLRNYLSHDIYSSSFSFRSETGSRTGGWSWRGRCRTPWLTPVRQTSPLSWCITPSCRPTDRVRTRGTTQQQQQHRTARPLPPTSIHTACSTAQLCPASPPCPWTLFISTTASLESCCPLPRPNSWARTRLILSITERKLWYFVRQNYIFEHKCSHLILKGSTWIETDAL